MTNENIAALISDNESLKARCRVLEDEIADLKGRIDWFTRQIFGSKSERYVTPDGQMSLDLGFAPTPAPEVQTETITYDRQKMAACTPHGREEIPAHLPRKEIVIMPDADVSGMEKIGEKVTEQVHYKSPEYWVSRIIRPVFAGAVNGVRTVVCAELPPNCNEKGKYGSSFIAHATVSKFEDHIPLYRLRQQILRDGGMAVAETTLDRLPEIAAFWLEPIVIRMKAFLMGSGYIQMDESTLRVMIKPTNGTSKTGYMWVRGSPEQRIVVFDYDRHRSGEVARRLLGDYRGVLQTDGYVVYDGYGDKDGITHAGCHAHARRGFEESLSNDRNRAVHALEVYRLLFAIEAPLQENHASPEQRHAVRQEQSKPIISEFKQWLDKEMTNVRPKNLIGKAIAYCLNRWEQLTRFLEDGRIEISNNLVENSIRPLALGRKNWLFAGSEDAARRIATIYSVQGTCKAWSKNFRDYTAAVLEEIPKRKDGDIDDLLPMNWKPNR